MQPLLKHITWFSLFDVFNRNNVTALFNTTSTSCRAPNSPNFASNNPLTIPPMPNVCQKEELACVAVF